MLPRSSFRRTLFVAVFAVALIPVVLTLGGGALLVREIGATTGTAGPWDAVAESGRTLIDAALAAAPGDSLVVRAATEHGAALSESVRWSRIYALLVERSARLLPLVVLVMGLLLAVLAAWIGGRLSRRLSEPIRELVEWTRRIGRGEPLPEPATAGGTGRGASAVTEFTTLRDALRDMEGEIRTAREREVEDARMRAWAEMARRVAHDLKNPLTPIRVSAGALVRSGDSAVRDAAEIILEEAERLDERARAFARYGRPPEGPAAEVDMAELIRKLSTLHGGGAIPVEVSIEGEIPRILGHHDALERALTNLVVNAVEALEDRDDGRVRLTARAEGGTLVVTVDDNGPGIPSGLQDRIWEADFTTRRRGTGLGLAIVRQNIESHGGRVTAGASPLGGARFRVELPRENE